MHNLLFSLTSFAAEAEAHTAESSGGIGAIGINGKALLFQIINFAILFWLLKKFAYKPIAKALEDRRKTIDESLVNAAKIEERTAKLEIDIEQQLRKARSEADAVIRQANQEAGKINQAAQDKAAATTEQMIKDGEAKIESELVKAKLELQKEMLDLLADATEAVLKEKIDRTKDAQLLKDGLARVREEI